VNIILGEETFARALSTLMQSATAITINAGKRQSFFNPSPNAELLAAVEGLHKVVRDLIACRQHSIATFMASQPTLTSPGTDPGTCENTAQVSDPWGEAVSILSSTAGETR